MAKGTTIQNYFTQAVQKQFARDILFRVKSIKVVGGELLGNNQLVYARTAKLPGRDIDNKVVNYSGQTFNVPGKVSYPGSESYQIEFYHDEEANLREQFENISRAIFDHRNDNIGEYSMPGSDSIIELNILDRQLNEIGNIKLIGASIRKIGEISYEIADGTGEILKFPVDFAYHWYEMSPTSTKASIRPPG